MYGEEGIAEDLAESINDELKKTGFKDLGIFERPDLIVLRRTMMPAVLVEAGFIDNPEDNARFDREFEAVAQAIADGILNTLREEGEARSYYMVQTGVYRARSLAGFLWFCVCVCPHVLLALIESRESTWGISSV